MNQKSGRSLRVLLCAFVVIALLLVTLYRGKKTHPPIDADVPPLTEKVGQKAGGEPFPEGSREATGDGDKAPPASASKMEEDAFAVAVEGEPLLVILPWYEEIGKISIEEYDREGNATGKPLKSGTMVQIPDPFEAGERIRFVVP